jgi:hypothetical protein
MYHRLTTLAAITAMVAPAMAQSVVVPNANATTRGTSQLNSIIRNAGNPRTYQYGINAAELAGIPVGSTITGVSLRFSALASNTISWPPADITWSNYDIWIGPANPTAGWVADPMQNFTSPPQQVRSGPMTLDAGVFSNQNLPAPAPNPWADFFFSFQSQYVYAGGDLAMLFSHPGSNDAAIALYPETVASNAATYGVGRSQSIYPVGVATTGTTFYVMRVHYGFGVGCSGTSSVPVLVQNANTTGGAGGRVLLQTGNSAAGAPVIVILGFAQLNVPLPGGCPLLVTPDVTVVTVADAKGRSNLAFDVPPAMIGGVFAQALIIDPTAPGSLTTTNGVSPTAF